MLQSIADFLAYFAKYGDKMLEMTLQHLQIVTLVLLISILIAMPLSLALYRSHKLSTIVLAVLGALYAIPSLAFFAILIPLLGLGIPTAVTVLVVYTQFILVRNILAGFKSVDPFLLEAGRGMGLSASQLFFKVQLPLAMPALLGGLRLAVISSIGMATIAAMIGAGGLGTLLFDGLRMNFAYKIVWGTILASALSLIANRILLFFEKRAMKRARGELHLPKTGRPSKNLRQALEE
ncbi:osmoprotectant transport system permease protein [Paenibacillus sophorae]|uniref:ABC transporter permease n=1 Tax=Paenibacillus sophorae TaxID=1333845 RepID=A0A1H8VPH3_9BACL|nr:ABC transporter permease [Paenibacillus sophorae]QWU17604.1 ABC transporter permease [Paenibacillus sophorae]SEP17193.1 osmoprotectant transport system permease protein [Paenibacillus sophorae]